MNGLVDLSDSRSWLRRFAVSNSSGIKRVAVVEGFQIANGIHSAARSDLQIYSTRDFLTK
jgi:hypothetical protein